MTVTSIERRNALKISLDLALAAVARGGLRQKELDRRRVQIAACRRALREIEIQLASTRAEVARDERARRVKQMRIMRDDENMTLQQIADKVGISKQAVSHQLGSVGRRKLTAWQEQCLKLKEGGKSVQEIAFATGKSYNTIWEMLDRLGALDKRAYNRKDGK